MFNISLTELIIVFIAVVFILKPDDIAKIAKFYRNFINYIEGVKQEVKREIDIIEYEEGK